MSIFLKVSLEMTTQRFTQRESEEGQFTKEKREKRMEFHNEVDLIEEKIHNISQGIYFLSSIYLMPFIHFRFFCSRYIFSN